MPENKFELSDVSNVHINIEVLPSRNIELTTPLLRPTPTYAVQPNGDLLWYRHYGVNDGRNRWAEGSGKKVGEGWADFTHIIGGVDGVIYAVKRNGNLLWYRHLGRIDGTIHWADKDGKKVSNNWFGFTRVLGGTDGVIYTVQPNGDLHWYRHLGFEDGSARWAKGSGNKIGNGWGEFAHLFGGTDGVIYAVQPSGDLLWYRHLGFEDGSARWAKGSGNKIGNGWGEFTHLTGGVDGVIYAVHPNGVLVWYHHLGFKEGSDRWAQRSGNGIGNGWGGFTNLFGSKNRMKGAPASVLQWRVRWWREYESDDDFLQGSTDETAVRVTGLDTSMTVTAGTSGKPALELVHGGWIPDLLARRDRRPDLLPAVLLELDLTRPTMWPRTFIVILQFIEADNADLAELFDKIEREYGKKIDELLVKAGVAIGGVVGGLILGSGGAKAGEELGVYLGEGLKIAHQKSAPLILDGLKDEIFPPVVLALTIDNPENLRPGSAFSRPQTIDLHWSSSTARYSLDYDWITL